MAGVNWVRIGGAMSMPVMIDSVRLSFFIAIIPLSRLISSWYYLFFTSLSMAQR